jgi:hypothetical protein
MSESENKRHVTLNLEHCHGCMGCVEMCPEVVGWNDANDRPYLKRLDVTEEEIQEAMACCPKDCFEFEED